MSVLPVTDNMTADLSNDLSFETNLYVAPIEPGIMSRSAMSIQLMNLEKQQF